MANIDFDPLPLFLVTDFVPESCSWEDGKFVTARQYPIMALVVPTQPEPNSSVKIEDMNGTMLSERMAAIGRSTAGVPKTGNAAENPDLFM